MARGRRMECNAEVAVGQGGGGADCQSSAIAAENCALRCMSGTCYGQIYADDPLEEGEIDTVRGRKFRNCVKKELRVATLAANS